MKIKKARKNTAVGYVIFHRRATARTFLVRYVGIRGYAAKGLR